MKGSDSTSEAWLDVLDLLDRYELSANDVMLLAETLFDMASKYLEEECGVDKNNNQPSTHYTSTIFRSPILDRFPLSKSRWGLDSKLLTEEN